MGLTTRLSSQSPSRPMLRWPGGKYVLGSQIIEFFPPHRTYVEPFCGGASVFVRKPRAFAECLNDLDGDLVNFFRILRDPETATELARLLTLTPYALEEYLAAFDPCTEPLERARRLLVRSLQGFDGEGALGRLTGWRRSRARRGTLNAHDWPSYIEQIPYFTERLQGVLIDHRDAFDVIRDYDEPDALFFIDPPYLKGTCRGFRGYRHNLSREGHITLAAVLHAITGMVVLSGYWSKLYADLYRGWEYHELLAYDTARQQRREGLWLNPHASEGLAQLKLFPLTPILAAGGDDATPV